MKTDIWMPLYIGDYLADTIGLSDQQHGRYLLAIMAYWRKHSPLTDGEALAILKDDADALRRFFVLVPGFWTHKRVDRELASADANKVQKSEAGKKGMATRWGNHNGVITVLKQSNNGGGNEAITEALRSDNPSPSSSPSPSTPSEPKPSRERRRFAPPTIDEVKLQAAKIGLPESEAEQFHAYYESNGWRVGRNPMVSWSSAMIKWRSNWQKGTYGEPNKKHTGNNGESGNSGEKYAGAQW